MNLERFGPFSVAPSQISRLSPTLFTSFVNELLDVETAAAGMSRVNLTTTYRDNVPDGGVDEGIRRAQSTSWIPDGDSAWQFKSGNPSPAACAAEIAKASTALEIIRSGGKYRLVVGVDINEKLVNARRKKVIAKLVELGIPVLDDTVEVLNASALASWAESHPSLAVSPLLSGIGQVGQSFDAWTLSNRQQAIWVSSPSRQSVIDSIRNLVQNSDHLDMRIEGVSGVGKTRVVMEALRGEAAAKLVVYVHAADALAPTMIHHLLAQNRAAVIVIDECSSRKHESLAGLIPTASSLRLITMGEPDSYYGQSPRFVLAPLDSESMDKLLRENQPNLWPEARRVVVEAAGGNARLALLLAKGVMQQPNASASDLITSDTIRAFITQSLPDGTTFLACSALALFTRLGYDKELSSELELVASSLGFSDQEMKSAVLALKEAGLLNTQGRYRSVGPHPLAVYLAARGWEHFGDQIVTRLLPSLSADMAERLFRRAADIGDFTPTHDAIIRILKADGPFASLDSLSTENNGRVLSQFAVVAPDEVCEHLTALIERASEDELHELTSIRRDLVWTLEKLVWHTRSFEQAANALLRLALVETEQYSNNATGTWVELFGLMLPGTAARPADRMTYLRALALAQDSRIRSLVVNGAAHALSIHESIMVSGEVQGGVVVERRGTPATYEEALTYRKEAIDLLRSLATDVDEAISKAATKTLLGAIHPFLEDQMLRDHLGEALLTLPSESLPLVRTAISSLGALFDRVEDASARREALDALEKKLPLASDLDTLKTLAHTPRWDLPDGELLRRIVKTAQALSRDNGVQALLRLLEAAIPAAFEVGHAIADLAGRDETTLNELVTLAVDENSAALVGFLWGRVEAGDDAAFDSALDSAPIKDLSDDFRLMLTIRGPRSDRAWDRAMRLVRDVPVRVGAQSLFGWHVGLSADQLGLLLSTWAPRIESQEDYNATTDFLSMALHGVSDGWDEQLDPEIATLVARRSEFPQLGQQSWNWAQLAKRQIDHQPDVLLELLLDFIENDVMHVFDGTEESSLIRVAMQNAGDAGQASLFNRLSAGSWRLQLSGRGWLIGLVPVEKVAEWIGADVTRARVVASVTSPGGSSPTPIGRFLLTNFGNDERVTSSLAGEFISGFWSGNESDRITSQIEQLSIWLTDPEEADGVKRWARKMKSSLEKRRTEALEREAEQGF
ncbi:hypothetical protein [Arthrobacter sp. KNU40]|uniref:hypothetical protein n=1 Tax=Arthrobacter sp. KNU40 TaxID=3447965 RepID=UPI003F644F3B